MNVALFLPHLDVAGGLGVHCRMVANALSKIDCSHLLTILAPQNSKSLFPTVAPEPFEPINDRLTIVRIDVPTGFNLANELDPLLSGPLRANKPDVLYCSYYTGMKSPPCRQIVAFHDAGFLENPEGFGATAGIRKATLDSIRDSIQTIHCISHDAQSRICRLLPWPREKTKVIWHAMPDSDDEISNALKSGRPASQPIPYFLSPVGGATGFNRKRKNIPMAVKAFRQLTPGSAKLVIAGTAALTPLVLEEMLPANETGAIQDESWLSDDGAISILPTISRDDLLQLMRHAVAVVYPSRYEGFGLPTIEAMAVGTPLIAAKATSIPEIVGEAGMLVEPDNLTGFTFAMSRVLNDPLERSSLIELGRQRLPLFTLERLSREMVELFEQVR